MIGVLEGDGLLGEKFLEFANNNLQLIKQFIIQLQRIGIEPSLSVANINITNQLLVETGKIRCRREYPQER